MAMRKGRDSIDDQQDNRDRQQKMDPGADVDDETKDPQRN
jgi:hypothetical protein